jgi:methylsterol monooxygenase
MFYYTVVPFMVHMLIYWSTSGFFYVLDRMYMDKEHVNWKKYPIAAKTSFINQMFISFPSLYLLRSHIEKAVISSYDDTIYVIFIKLFLIINLSNLLFYSFHRILHIKFFYNHIHYRHHEFNEPVAVAALYAHPIEHFTTNTMSFILPFILIGTSYSMMLVLLGFASLITVLSHTSHNRMLPTFNDHMIHHKLFRYNYGFGGYIDRLFNTFREEKLI